jgi:hypothetical protein
MQFRKTSKQTRTTAEKTAAAPEIGAPGENFKPRTTRSSKSKSSQPSEPRSAKHRKTATEPPTGVTDDAPAVAGKVMNGEAVEPQTMSHEQIAALAHSYWVARGYAPGSPEQDWLRAERELKVKR